jgi:2-deoxy-D-gluconate 3-dehydrogenase
VVPENAPYLASKAGLAHLVAAMANELASEGIRVLGVAPGIVATDMTSKLRQRPEWAAERLARIPADRFAEPEEIAEFMVDLSGPRADYVHGTTVVIDGGYLAGR